MSEDRTEEDTAFDADQLAALARPSLPPTQNDDDDDDDDDAPLDLKALTASMAPPAPSDDASDDEDDDDDDGRVSMAGVSGAASSSADSSKADAKADAAKSSKSGDSKSGDSKSKSSGKSEAKSEKAPVAAAVAEEPESGGSGKMLIGLIALLGVGAVVFALTQNAEPEEQAALYPAADPAETPTAQQEPEPLEEETTPLEETTPVETGLATDENDETNSQPVEGTPADDTDANGSTAEAATPASDARRARRRAASMDSEAATMDTAEATDTATMEAAEEPSMAAETAETAETMEAEPTMETSSMDDMDDLLTRALGGTPTAGGTMTEATMEVAMEDRSSLPETPSRAAVTRALGGLMPRMRQCAGDQVGMATARIRVNNNGQVVSSNIGGSPFGGTPQGACMERVVRTARFPRFQRTHFDVTYPFSIRAIN